MSTNGTYNPTRPQLLEQFQRHTDLSVTRETSTYRPWTGNEVRYDFEKTLARLAGSDHRTIAAAADADARKLRRIGMTTLWAGVAIWLLGATALAAGDTAIALPTLVIGSVAFFYGARKLSASRHDRRLIADLQILVEEVAKQR